MLPLQEILFVSVKVKLGKTLWQNQLDGKLFLGTSKP